MSEIQRFPVAKPSLTDLEKRYVADALESGWISSQGPYLRRFEEDFAVRCNSASAIATANGTTALHLALAAIGIGPGDEVIVPAATYVATANAVAYCHAKPVFVDVLPSTWCIDAEQVRSAIGPRTKAVIAVDLYGHPADYAQLREVCDSRGIVLVSDAAESFGGRVGKEPVGSLADVTAFSFFGNKVITCGEGGCVTTSDPETADRLRLLRNQGMDPGRRYFFPVIGFNYRLTNVAAAILCAQLERCREIISRREAIIDQYETALAGHPLLSPQPVAGGVRRGPWMASFLVGPPGIAGPRDALANRLAEQGVDTRPFFTPIPALPPYLATARDYPIAADLSQRGINLPTYVDLTDSDVRIVIDRILTAASETSALRPPAERRTAM